MCQNRPLSGGTGCDAVKFGLPLRRSLGNLRALMQKKILVAGAGGFIGGHLVAELLRKGHTDIRAVDIKPFGEWYQKFPQVENLQLDLQLKDACEKSAKGAETIYNLACRHGRHGLHRK